MALILASALFSAGAWGQTVIRQSATGVVAVGSEFFGAAEGREVGGDIAGDATGPTIVLSSFDAQTGSTAANVTAGNVADITFTLKGAMFTGPVSASTLTDSSGATNITTERRSGGTEGDNSVTFRVEIETATPGPFHFRVPILMATGAVLATNEDTGAPTAIGVGVTSMISSVRASGTPFPDVIQGADDSDAATVDPIGVMQSQVYNTMLPALMYSWTAPVGDTELVSVEDRKVIIKTAAKSTDPSDESSSPAAALRVGTVNVSATLPTADQVTAGTAVYIKDLDGEDDAVMTATDEADRTGTALAATAYEVGNDLSGDAAITVIGPFQSGDMVYLGGKAMTIDGGMAMGSMDIEALLQDEDGLDVVYVPGGVDDLKPSSFTAIGVFDFDDDDNADVTAGPRPFNSSTGMLKYKDFDNQGYAYGIVKGGGMDQSYVRVTCESAAPCLIFADCTDQAGMSYFGGPVPLGPGQTGVVSSDDIAAALGGGWDSGRGRCELVSNRGLSVQHMVRSGHTLVNNSVVINKEIAATTYSGYTCVLADTNDDMTIDATDNHGARMCTPTGQ